MTAEIEKLAEQYAKKRSELDPVYANGLYYGYLEGFKNAMDQEQKNIVIGTYIDLKMTNHNLPYGKEYHNLLSRVEEEAELYYNKKFGK